MSRRNTYFLRGLSYKSCANKYEEKVRKMEDVKEVQFNFSTGILSIIGDVTIEALEQASTFEKVEITEARKPFQSSRRFFRNERVVLSIVAFITLLIGLAMQFHMNIGYPYIPTIYIVALSIAGYPLFKTAVYHLLLLEFNFRIALVFAVIGAIFLERWLETVFIAILINIHELMVSFSVEKGRESLQSIIGLTRDEVTVKRKDRFVNVDIASVHVGDIMKVEPGEIIGLDGRIIDGSTVVGPNSVLRFDAGGEKFVGDQVNAGSLNQNNLIYVEVTHSEEDTLLTKMISFVEEAQNIKAPSQHFIENIATYFTSLVILLASLIALLPPLITGSSWSLWIYLGLAVLIIASPCSIFLSTFLAMTISVGNLARHGALVKNGTFIEEMNRIN